jgi:hypothetical protein
MKDNLKNCITDLEYAKIRRCQSLEGLSPTRPPGCMIHEAIRIWFSTQVLFLKTCRITRRVRWRTSLFTTAPRLCFGWLDAGCIVLLCRRFSVIRVCSQDDRKSDNTSHLVYSIIRDYDCNQSIVETGVRTGYRERVCV